MTITTTKKRVCLGRNYEAGAGEDEAHPPHPTQTGLPHALLSSHPQVFLSKIFSRTIQVSTNELTCCYFEKVFTFDCKILDTLTFHFHDILQSMSLSFQRPISHLSPSLVQPPLWAQEHALRGALTSFLYSM